MAQDPHEPEADSDDILARADALLARSRRMPAVRADTNNPPVLADAIEVRPAEDDIPTLTEVVVAADAEPLPALMPLEPDSTSGEIISRVQNQNMEHAAHLRVM